jgi:CheY-like chemotaxis protein
VKTYGKYILYADDDQDDHELMHETMQATGSGVDVIAVRNGIEALQFLANLHKGENYPSLIVLDVNMPVVGGYQALRLLKLNPVFSKIPVAIFSTSSMPDEVRKAKRFGAVDFITKPLYYAEFLKVCKRLAAFCLEEPEGWRELT